MRRKTDGRSALGWLWALTFTLASFWAVTPAMAQTALPLTPPARSERFQTNEVRPFLDSVVSLDQRTGDVTLPLYVGKLGAQDVWFVLTESSDKKEAKALGLNHAPKLANALGTAAVQNASVQNGVLNFEGTVDFSPVRIVVPGPQGFPPTQFQPGAVGDARYSPLFTLGDGIVRNGSHVANATGLHDAIVAIDRNAGRVTLDQFFGFYDDKLIVYLHQDASVALVAAVEGSTFAPNLNAAPGLGSDDENTSAREAIIPIVNGPRGVDNPERQGLESALLGQGDPLNIIQEEPGDVEYSPVWDLHLVVWTDAAIAAGLRVRLTSDHDVVDAFEAGLVVSGGDGPANPSLGGLRAANAISNCPVTAEIRIRR